MAFIEDCIERATALAATCGWLAFGGGGEAAAGVVIGAAGLATLVTGAVRRHGPESEAALRSIRASISKDISAFAASEGWENRSDLEAADLAMERALSGCFLDREALADSARSSEGFPGAATRLIVAKLAEREPKIFGPSGSQAAKGYAQLVVKTALEAAIENEAYFRALSPHLLMETLRGIGSVEERLETMHDDIKKILMNLPMNGMSPFTLAAETIDGIWLELTASESGKVLLFHSEPFPYELKGFEFDPRRRELRLVLPGGFKREWGIQVRQDIARNMLENSGQLLMVKVDIRNGEPVDGAYLPLRILAE